LFKAANVTGATFQNNTATSGGGAYFDNTTNLISTTFINNTAGGSTGGGGAFFANTTFNYPVNITESIFQNNTATIGDGGGALFYNKGTTTVIYTTFMNNSATHTGGGAYFFGTANVTNTTFMTNTAANQGGGAQFNAKAYITNTVFINNNVTNGDGGGAYFDNNPTNTPKKLVNTLFARNSATTNGAAIYVDGATPLEIIHTTIASPTAPTGATEAVYVLGGIVRITNTIIASHTTGIERAGGTVNENHNLFSDVAIPYSGMTGGANSITDTADFYDTIAYTLTKTSAAIDSGQDLSISNDYFGQARPFSLSNIADIGYDESPFTMQDIEYSVMVTPASVNEGDSGTQPVTFTVTRDGHSRALTHSTTISYTLGGTAINGQDYNGSMSGTLTFASHQVSQTVIISVTGDTMFEADDPISLTLSNGTALTNGVVTYLTHTAIITISNDDSAPAISIINVTQAENGGSMVFTVTLNRVSAFDTAMNYTTHDQTATAGSDYTASSGVLTITAGFTQSVITVSVTDDLENEVNETFTVNLSNLVNGSSFINGQGLGTILDNDAPPPPINQSPSGLADSYIITQNNILTVTVPGVLANDRDHEGQALSAMLILPPQHGNLTLRVNGSFSYRPTPSFIGTDSFSYVASDGALNSNLTNVTIIVPPLPNQPPVITSSLHYTMTESTILTVPTITGLLSNISDADHDPLTVTLITPPLTGTLQLNVTGSFVYTPPMGFTGTITLTYQVSDGRGGIITNTATIEVLAKPITTTNLQVSKTVTPNGQVMPGQMVTYTIYYTNAGVITAQQVVISDAMLAVSQPLGSLMSGESGRLTLTYQVSPTLMTNTIITNIVAISSATTELDPSDNVAIVTNTVILPRVDFDRPDYIIHEGDGAAVITLTLSHAPFVTVTVGVKSEDLDSMAGLDYQAVSQTVMFKPGQSFVTLTVPITDDLLDEVTETVMIRWQNPQGALAGAINPVTLTIVDNDETVITPPVVVVYTPSITLTLTATPQSAKVGQVITYHYAVTNTGNISLSAISSQLSGDISYFLFLPSHLGVGESITGTFSYTVQVADFPAPIVATMQVTGTAGFSVTTAVATSTVELMRNVTDLSLSKVASPNPVMVNGLLTYTLVVTNNGPDVASEVILTDTLPHGVTLIANSTACEWQTVLTCTLGLLMPNMTRTLTVTVKPTITGSITNTARVYSPNFDPAPTNNVATATTEIGWVALKVIMTVRGDKFVTTNTVVVGSRVTYTLWITNLGTLTATQLVFTDTMPATMTQLLVVRGVCNNGTPLICPLDDLGPQSSISKTLVVRVTSEGVLTDTVEISAHEMDGVMSNTVTLTAVKLHIYLPLLQKNPPPPFEVPQ
jgi:uncharacterized repeat protein (TIGR01451 family)